MSNIQSMFQTIKEEAIRFDSYDDLDAIVEAIVEAKYVLLGEASHGTSEFYTVRAELSKKLMKEKGFSFIAVEGDWPSCFSVNRYVKGYDKKSARDALKDFNRWPTWMWANEEVLSFIQWIKDYNQTSGKNVGFYGIDVYSLWESMEEAVRLLETKGAKEAEAARKAFSCFEPHNGRAENYGIHAAFYGEDCIDEVMKLLIKIRENRHDYQDDYETSLNLEINALVAVNAERYYRSMVQGGPDDWNIRDHHMVSALEQIMAYYGTGAKAIVWEHNTHIGDARATDMKKEGLVNVGQILRERAGKTNVFALGFGTHRGSVLAARKWGEAMETMAVPPAEKGSWEDLMHQTGEFNKILFFSERNRKIFNDPIGHRAIGVVYHPEYEHLGNYVPSIMSERYDGFIHIEQTTALKPIAAGEVTVD